MRRVHARVGQRLAAIAVGHAEREALVSSGHVLASVEIEELDGLDERAARAANRSGDVGGGDTVIDHERDVARDRGEAGRLDRALDLELHALERGEIELDVDRAVELPRLDLGWAGDAASEIRALRPG